MKKIFFLLLLLLFLFGPVRAEEERKKIAECRPRQPAGWCENYRHRRMAARILAKGIPLKKPGRRSIAVICGKKNTKIHIFLRPKRKSGTTLTIKSIYPFKIFGVQLNEIDKEYDWYLYCPVYSATFYNINKEPIYMTCSKCKKRRWRVVLTPNRNQQEFWFETQ